MTCRTFHCMSHPYAAHEKNQTNKKKLLGSLILLKGQDCTDFHNFPDEFCIASFQLASKKKQKKPTGIAPVSKNSGASQSVLFQSVGDCCRLTSRLGMALSQLNVPTLKDRPQLRVTRLHQPMPPSTQVENTRPYKAFNQETL